MLYTPVDPALIWEGGEAAPVKSLLVGGRLCLARRDAEGSWRLERLLSTDPADYLEPRWTPNRLLGWGPDCGEA